MIRQELNPVTCKLDRKQINLRRILKIHENNDDVGVLGLAPCHHREKSQVRQTDQVWYHHQLQVSSLAVDLQWCYCPLHSTDTDQDQRGGGRRTWLIAKAKTIISGRRGKKKEKEGSFTSIQMLHTQTTLFNF